MKYGALPVNLGLHAVDCREFMFYQDMPVKLAGSTSITLEPRVQCFGDLIGRVCCDFVGAFGLNKFVGWNTYISAKRMYQEPGKPMNRPGWHADGFMSDDINYIWSDRDGTVFNVSPFKLSQDDVRSMREMDEQADPSNNMVYADGTLSRLDQFNIHRVADARAPGVRTFLKVTFSKDRYNLIGNARNYLIDYDWPMRERGLTRNVPQATLARKFAVDNADDWTQVSHRCCVEITPRKKRNK